MANYVTSIFGSSPVAPLERHIDQCYQCAKLLLPFFKAVIQADWDEVDTIRDRIAQMESGADDLKQEIRAHLPKSLFMPVPREDLLELLLVQDKIANIAKDISGLVVGRRMELPEEISAPFLEFVECCVMAAKQARKSVRELDELFESGFRGAEVTLVAGLIEELDRLESNTDALQSQLRAALFEIEARLPPVNVIFLYRVIELTGEIADMAERVGRRLELLLSH